MQFEGTNGAVRGIIHKEPQTCLFDPVGCSFELCFDSMLFGFERITLICLVRVVEVVSVVVELVELVNFVVGGVTLSKLLLRGCLLPPSHSARFIGLSFADRVLAGQLLFEGVVELIYWWLLAFEWSSHRL